MPNQCLSAAAAADVNVSNISRLEKGMTQIEVLKIMRQPHKAQVFVLENEIYDVWFYVTGRVVLGQSRMMPLNLTPLAFCNGILIGWGAAYYNYLKHWQASTEKENPSPPSPPSPETKEKGRENKQLEKILKSDLAFAVSMSAKPKTEVGTQDEASPPKKAEKNKIPLTEEDEEMLHEEQEQDFDQT